MMKAERIVVAVIMMEIAVEGGRSLRGETSGSYAEKYVG
jgi:hypothetical protein